MHAIRTIRTGSRVRATRVGASETGGASVWPALYVLSYYSRFRV